MRKLDQAVCARPESVAVLEHAQWRDGQFYHVLIIETAKVNGLHPYHYVKFLLEKLPAATTGNLEAFLPWSDSLPDCCRLPIKKGTAKGA